MTIPEPTDCPYYLISRATLAITAYLRRELEAAGVQKVRPAYIGVLMSLWLEDGVQAGALGRRAGLERSSMTGLLDRMERDGLVRREPDPHDRRAQRICLTEHGRQVREPVMAVVDKTMESVFRGIPAKKLSGLKNTLRSILSKADKLS